LNFFKFGSVARNIGWENAAPINKATYHFVEKKERFLEIWKKNLVQNPDLNELTESDLTSLFEQRILPYEHGTPQFSKLLEILTACNQDVETT